MYTSLKFNIKLLNPNLCVCFSLDYSRPDEYYDEMEQKLIEMNFTGTLIMDLLLCNGFGRRFFEIYFDKSIIYTPIKWVPELDAELLKECNSFYEQNQHLIDNSVIVSINKFHETI